MEAGIRKVQKRDANAPAYIQTESWKAAFAGIPDTETLAKCTNINRAAGMYQRLLDKNIGNGYILSADGNPAASHIGMRPVTRNLLVRRSCSAFTAYLTTGIKGMTVR